MMSDIKEDIPDFVKVEVKSEVNWDNTLLPENEHPVGDSIDSMVDDYSTFKIKKELEYTDNDEINTDNLKQVDSTYANFKCKEEIKEEGPYEIPNKFKTENDERVEEFYENSESDEKIDIFENILQTNDANVKIESENDSETQKALKQPVDDPPKQGKEKKHYSTMHSNSIHNKKSKMKNCKFCNKSFKAKQSLDDHILKHHKQEIKGDVKSLITAKIHTCNICNSFETTKKNDFDRHIISVHEVQVKMNCQFCAESFMCKQSLDEHVLRKHKDKIKIDVKSFITRKIHVCKICSSYETTRKSNLDHHLSSAHNKAKIKMNCRYCNKSFTKKMYLDDHILKNHKHEIKGDLKSLIKSKVYKCNICNYYESTSKYDVDRHVNTVHNEVKIKVKCQFCTKSLIDKRSLNGHILTKHKDKIKNDIKSFITTKIHVCNICNSFETTRKCSLDQHINLVHNKVKIKIKCQFCTDSLIHKQSLDEHVLKKHKDKIEHDIKSFITSKIHVCKICNSYETTHKSSLEQHINLFHNKVKIKCQFCTDSLIHKQSLNEHLLKKHKDDIKNDIKSFIPSKILVCKFCKSFETTVKSHLNQHINSFHNKRKIKCQFCAESLIHKRSLDEHLLRKHKDEIKNDINSFITNKIHVCKICNTYESTHKSHLDRHINSVHKTDTF